MHTPRSPLPAAAASGTTILVVLSASHLINDSYTSLLTPLLPQLRDSYGTSIAQTAVLVAVSSFVGSMLQPLFGLLADHSDRRLLAALGPALAGLGMTLMGYAPTFGALAMLVALGGVGSALFHPSAVAYVHQGARAEKRGLYAALFSAGGTAGLAVGPLVATALSLRSLPFLLPAGLAIGLVSWFVTPSTRSAARSTSGWRDYAAVFRGPIRLLWGMSVLRSLSTVAYLGLVGFALAADGFGSHIGPTLAVFSLASAIGGVFGGEISDRLGRVRVLRSTVLLPIPLFCLLVYSTPGDWWYYALTAVVGALVNANVPVSVVAAQEYAPRHVATASAFMMGFAWGTSGVLFMLVGWMADLTSPRTAMVASILVLLPAFWITLRLPEPERALAG